MYFFSKKYLNVLKKALKGFFIQKKYLKVFLLKKLLKVFFLLKKIPLSVFFE